MLLHSAFCILLSALIHLGGHVCKEQCCWDSTCPPHARLNLAHSSVFWSVENKWLKHDHLSVYPSSCLLIPPQHLFNLVTLPPQSPVSPFAAFPPFPFSFSSFPQIIMTIPIAVKDRTVSNKTVNDNTVINRIVTTNTVIASASKSLTSSIYTICWVFREYLSLQSVRMFSYIDDTTIVSDNTNSSGQ